MALRAPKRPDGYETETRGPVTVLVLRSMRRLLLDDALSDFRVLDADGAPETKRMPGGRGPHFSYAPRGSRERIVVRRYRRGGMATVFGRWLFSRSRSLNELLATSAAGSAGLRVPTIAAVRVERIAPRIYRHTIATKEIEGAVPLRGFLGTATAAARRRVAAEIGRNLRKMHDVGIDHVDLTVDNILVAGESVWLIDFDGARVVGTVSPVTAARRIRRLFRSTVKWPATAHRLTATDRMRFLRAYYGGREGARAMARRCESGLWLHRFRWAMTGAGRER